MSNDKLVIPELLCGRHAAVMRKWKRVAKRAIEMGSVARAMEKEMFIPIEEAAGSLILEGDGGPIVDGENTLLYPVVGELKTLAYSIVGGEEDRPAWIRMCDSLILPALDMFWFSLAALAGQSYIVTLRSDPREQAKASLAVLKKLLRWWPEFYKLDDRFSLGMGLPERGYRWGRVTWDLARDLGKSDEWIRQLQEIDPDEALDRFLDLVIAADKEYS